MDYWCPVTTKDPRDWEKRPGTLFILHCQQGGNEENGESGRRKGEEKPSMHIKDWRVILKIKLKAASFIF